MFILIAAVVLCLAAFGDGYTTQVGIKSGRLVEGNKILDWLYRTNTPSALQTFGVGFSIIAGEILLAHELMKHVNLVSPKLWPFGLLMQAGFHTYCIFSNYKLTTGKNLWPL